MEPSIVIVNYNTKDFLKQCLRLIISHEVIVVDNGSTNGSVEMMREEYSQLKLIVNKKNLGFAKAVNQGIRASQGEYILVLNSDIEVKGNALEKMTEFVKKHPEVGVVGGRLVNPDGRIQGSCFHRLTLINAIKEFWLGQKRAFEKYAPKTGKPTEIDAVVGACMLIPRKVINKVGYFDERYFLYFEDLDYCRRVKKVGFKIFYLPDAEFIHHHGASAKKIPQKTRFWLAQSSKIYHGEIKYCLLTLTISLGQKWQKLLKR